MTITFSQCFKSPGAWEIRRSQAHHRDTGRPPTTHLIDNRSTVRFSVGDPDLSLTDNQRNIEIKPSGENKTNKDMENMTPKYTKSSTNQQEHLRSYLEQLRYPKLSTYDGTTDCSWYALQSVVSEKLKL